MRKRGWNLARIGQRIAENLRRFWDDAPLQGMRTTKAGLCTKSPACTKTLSTLWPHNKSSGARPKGVAMSRVQQFLRHFVGFVVGVEFLLFMVPAEAKEGFAEFELNHVPVKNLAEEPKPHLAGIKPSQHFLR